MNGLLRPFIWASFSPNSRLYEPDAHLQALPSRAEPGLEVTPKAGCYVVLRGEKPILALWIRRKVSKRWDKILPPWCFT